MKFLSWTVLLLLTFLLNVNVASAGLIICWDGALVLSSDNCTKRPEPTTFSLFGGSAEGALVTLFHRDGTVYEYNIEWFGETGKAKNQYSTPHQFRTQEFRYNRPLFHPEFDNNATILNNQKFYIGSESEGKIVFKEKGEINVGLSCLHQAIVKHATSHVDVPRMSYSSVVSCINKYSN